ncbi:MAG: hypothetical protein WCG19_10860 [Chlorobiaceae bacterium]
MCGDLTIRTVRTASGATAVQVVQKEGKQRSFLKHIGSAYNEDELKLLMAEAGTSEFTKKIQQLLEF